MSNDDGWGPSKHVRSNEDDGMSNITAIQVAEEAEAVPSMNPSKVGWPMPAIETIGGC